MIFSRNFVSQYLIEIKKDDSSKVGTFGGENFPGVTHFMSGFIAGTKYYNGLIHPKHKVEFVKFASDADYTNSGFSACQGISFANKLLQGGIGVILPVAGPQTCDEISSINQNQKYNHVKF